MKKIVLLLFLLPLFANAAVYYVSPSGKDSNPGTITHPFANWEKGFNILIPGDTLYIRGGTYKVENVKADYRVYMHDIKGSPDKHIKILAYPGGDNPALWEHPVLDFSNITQTTNSTGFRVEDCGYIDFKGLRITGLVQQSNGNEIVGWSFWTSRDMTFELCEVDHMGGTGFAGRTGTNNLTFINCDSHHNGDQYKKDDSYGDADGFDCIDGVVAYLGCRAWWNSDDGFDCFGDDEFVTYQNCWSFWNGYAPGTFTIGGNGNGFKWGLNNADLSTTVLRNYSNCLSFQNRGFGFDQNVARCIALFYNNTSYQNAGGGWATGYELRPRVANVLKNNISFLDSVTVSDFEGLVQGHNSWNSNIKITNADFVSLDTTGVDGPRQPDGSLPNLKFLHLAANSKLIDAGVNVGLSTAGTTADVGAFQHTKPSTLQPKQNTIKLFLIIIAILFALTTIAVLFVRLYFRRKELVHNKKPDRL